MKRSHYLFILYTIVYLLSCNSSSNIPPGKSKITDNTKTLPSVVAAKPTDDSILLEKAIDSIRNTAKVKSLYASINKHPASQHNLAIMVASGPGDGQPYYWLKVGDDTPDHFATIYHFHVYLHPLKIMNYDVEEDGEVSLEEWENKKE